MEGQKNSLPHRVLWYTLAPMDHRKKTGIILIAIGLAIPLLALPFVSGWSKDKGFFANFYRIGIQIRGDKESGPAGEPFAGADTQGKGFKYSKLIPKRIPLRFFLVITLVFLYMGIVRIAPPRQEPDDEGGKRE
jgi:hypothetical protein